MGLDMYLYRVEKNSPPELDYLPWNAHNSGDDEVRRLYDKGFIARNQLAYWRKVNQIHWWFVKELRHGLDDCQPIPVPRAELERLLRTIGTVLENRSNVRIATVMLPRASGFFFGDTEYGEWYWKDLEETARMLEEILADEALDEYDVYYEASW